MEVLDLYECSLIEFEKIAKEFNINRNKFYCSDYLEMYTHITFTLYALDRPQITKFLSPDIEKLTFKDYTSWVWIRPLILLKAHLGMADKNFCIEKIRDAVNKGNELQRKINARNFNKLLNGETLNMKSFNRQDDLSKKENCFILITSIMNLIIINVMGGGEKFTPIMASNEINNCKEILKEIYLIK